MATGDYTGKYYSIPSINSDLNNVSYVSTTTAGWSTHNYPNAIGVEWHDPYLDKINKMEEKLSLLIDEVKLLRDVVRQAALASCKKGKNRECGRCIPCKSRLALTNEYREAVEVLAS